MRLLPLVLACALLGACSLVPAVAPLEAVSTITTEKTASDHIVSFTSGKNCSSIRREQGLTYCVEDEAKPAPQNAWCYPTLGTVTCYDHPDPFNGRQKRLGEAQPPVATNPYAVGN